MSTPTTTAAPPTSRAANRADVRPPARTKICGVTTTRDALAALDAGAELIGLNFYPPSPRYLTPEAAGDLVREVRRLRPAAAEDVLWVGVFVDESAEHMADVAEVADLDLLQLHGEEDPADMAALATRIIKVFRVRAATGDEELRTEVMRRMEPWRSLGVWGFLVDTHHPALYGGTGESWNFSALRYLAEDIGDRILLAGGLSPDNVGAALRACKPWGIDLCSGVESEPGRKDSDLLRRLFEEIHDGTTRPAT